MRLDEQGNAFYVERTAQVIRRRGENISAFEVEESLALLEGVVDSAVFGVPSPLTEEDVKVNQKALECIQQSCWWHTTRIKGYDSACAYFESHP